MLAGCGSSDSSSTTSTDAATEEKTDDTADAAAEESGDKKFKICLLYTSHSRKEKFRIWQRHSASSRMISILWTP